VAFQDSEDDRFNARSATLFSANTACTKIGFIDFNLAREGRWRVTNLGDSNSWLQE